MLKKLISGICMVGMLWFQPTIKATDIALAPIGTNTKEKIVFNKLEEAVNFEDGTPITINVYKGEFGESINYFDLRNKEIIGVQEGAILNTTIRTQDNSKVSNLRIRSKPNWDCIVVLKDGSEPNLKNVEISNCDIESRGSSGILVSWNNLENIVIKNNLIKNMSSACITTAYDISNGKPTFESNTFYRSQVGIRCLYATQLDLQPNNIFTGNKYNLDVEKLTSGTHIAENQYWCDENNNPLLTEQSILDSFNIRSEKSARGGQYNPPVDVVPFLTSDPNQKKARIKYWNLYK